MFSPYHKVFRIQKAKILLPPRKNSQDQVSRDESSGMSKYPSRFPGRLAGRRQDRKTGRNRGIFLDTQDSFPYPQPTQKQLLINSIIAFGVSNYDDTATMFQKKKCPMLVAASFGGERWCYFDTRPGGRVVVLERR